MSSSQFFSHCRVLAKLDFGNTFLAHKRVPKSGLTVYKPELNHYLSDKHIIDICCGDCHSLVLSNCGVETVWDKLGQIGTNWDKLGMQVKVNAFNDEKVVVISCDGWHSMALTESGRVYSWGYNLCR